MRYRPAAPAGLLPAGFILRQIDNKQLRDFVAVFRQRIANKRQRMVPHPALFIGAINLIAARRGSRRRAAHQHAPVAAAVFARMVARRRHGSIRRGHADVAQIQRRVALVQHMIVVGKTDQLAVGAIDMDVAAAAQRPGV